MQCIERFEKYRDDDLDRIIILIRNGTIKSGKYAHLVKVDDNKKMKGKEFFNDTENNKSE